MARRRDGGTGCGCLALLTAPLLMGVAVWLVATAGLVLAAPAIFVYASLDDSPQSDPRGWQWAAVAAPALALAVAWLSSRRRAHSAATHVRRAAVLLASANAGGYVVLLRVSGEPITRNYSPPVLAAAVAGVVTLLAVVVCKLLDLRVPVRAAVGPRSGGEPTRRDGPLPGAIWWGGVVFRPGLAARDCPFVIYRVHPDRVEVLPLSRYPQSGGRQNLEFTPGTDADGNVFARWVELTPRRVELGALRRPDGACPAHLWRQIEKQTDADALRRAERSKRTDGQRRDDQKRPTSPRGSSEQQDPRQRRPEKPSSARIEDLKRPTRGRPPFWKVNR